MVNSLSISKTDFFESARIVYRGINETDTNDLVKWRSDPEIIRFFRNPKPLLLHDHLDWFRNSYLKNNKRFDFIISDKFRAEKIGTVGVSDINYEKNSCEISFMVAEQNYRRKGLASEAIMSLMDRILEEGIDVFFAEIHKDNIASIRTVEKLGYMRSKETDDFLIFCKR